MKASVLIPAFRSRPFILTALQSVAAQTYEDWELIVVEDGSSDGTGVIVDAFAQSSEHRVVYRRLATNHGPGTVKNRLLECVTGEVVAFLNADDRWDPGHLSSAVEQIRNGCDVATSGVRSYDLTTGKTLETIESPSALQNEPLLTLFQQNAIPPSSAVVMTKDLVGRTGQFDPTLRVGGDRDYWLRCALEGARFGGTHAVTCNHARHDDTSIERTIAIAENAVRFYDKYRSLVEIPLKLRRRLLAASLIRLGILLRQRDPSRRAACLWRAWECEPFNPRIPFQLAFSGRWPIATEKAA